MSPNTVTVISIHPTGKRRLVRAPGAHHKLVFEEFRGVLDDTKADVRVFMDLAITPAAEPEIVGMAIEVKRGKGLYARDVKRLPLDTYVLALVGYMAFDATPTDPIHHAVVEPHPPRTGGVRWSKVTDAELADVARWWREAEDQGLPTGPHVAERAGVSHNNARQLILAARREGLIPPAQRPR